MVAQRERIATLRAQHCDPSHAIAILDEMTKGFVRLMERADDAHALVDSLAD